MGDLLSLVTKMPPKNSVSKAEHMGAKAKVIEDKTFGLKNKKGGKQQKYIANVEKQVKSGGNPDFRKQEAEQKKKKEEKEAQKQREMEMQSLFKSVPTQKLESGVDPKTVFCAFFKQGLCKKKEDKCKFSHDPACERKAAKRNIYEDDNKENMDEWDEDKLAEVVKKKHGAEASNDTDIICKHFLDAVENNKYGWFWECPIVKATKECKYRHALPKGFVLKKDKKKKEAVITIEELVETERSKLDSSKLTKITLQTFVAWKKKKLKKKKGGNKKKKKKKKKS